LVFNKIKKKRAFILLWVCMLAVAMGALVFALHQLRTGNLHQLSITINQNKLRIVAQSAINEILATIKSKINQSGSLYNKAVENILGSPGNYGIQGQAKVVFKNEFTGEELGYSREMGEEYFSPGLQINGEVAFVIVEKVGLPNLPSYLGYIEVCATVKDKKNVFIKQRERRELKIVNLADPFVDKYALFVKNYCPFLNSPDKRLVINGIDPNQNNGKFSFAYFGNNNYPTCKQYPQGARSNPTPPIRLDLNFEKDRNLLGGLYQANASLELKNSLLKKASQNNFFWTSSPVKFNNFSDSFSIKDDYYKIPELADIYLNIIEKAKKFEDVHTSIAYLIMRDYKKAGGNIANSEIFASIVRLAEKHWLYHFGYTDYKTISSNKLNQRPFSGLISYFDNLQKINPISAVGGEMPILFGKSRNRPVFIEGPVYLRFFKIALIDELETSIKIGNESIKIFLPIIPLGFEFTPQTISGKKLKKPIDRVNKNLMSKPVVHIPINNFFFSRNKIKPSTKTIGGLEGRDVYPYFASDLKTITHIYPTAYDFIKDMTDRTSDEAMLNLDGNILILGKDNKPLDLTMINTFRGTGRIILAQNDCHLADLKANDPNKDLLYIYLIKGNFQIKGNKPNVLIQASLAALNKNKTGQILPNSKSVTIDGNLIVDDLNSIKVLPVNGHLTINHPKNLYSGNSSVRATIGKSKMMLVTEYSEKNAN
jgi:hypothetical protein